jgi:hypothetical protein
LHSRDHAGKRNDPRQHERGEMTIGESNAGQHFAEDEQEKHRLDERLQQEWNKLAPGNDGIAAQDCEERFGGEHLAKMSPGERNKDFL